MLAAGTPAIELEQVSGSVEPMPGRCGAKIPNSDPPRYCMRWPRKGRNRCHKHGGKTPVGPAAGGWAHGEYSKYLKPAAAAIFDARMQDDNLISLRSSAALLDTRLIEVLQRAQATGFGAEQLRKIKSLLDEVSRAFADQDTAAHAVAVAAIERIANSGLAEQAAWREVREIVQEKRLVADSERKRMLDAKQFVTAEQAYALVTRVMHVVTTHVTDRAALAAISDEFAKLAGGKAP